MNKTPETSQDAKPFIKMEKKERTIDDILQRYRKNAQSNVHLGMQFERLIQGYLKTDKLYANKFKEVWVWSEFPFKTEFSGGHDLGIDLVGLTNAGDYAAIQCKCYQEDKQINKPDVDSFLSASEQIVQLEGAEIKFKERFWIDTTTKSWSTNIHIIIDNLKNFQRINLNDLRNPNIQWGEIERGLMGDKARKKPFEAKPYQQKAIDEVLQKFCAFSSYDSEPTPDIEEEVEYIEDEETTEQPSEREQPRQYKRGKLIMACGTGKTFTALRIAEKIKESIYSNQEEKHNKQPIILFLVPSISLISQVLKEWNNQTKMETFQSIVVCSDKRADITKKRTRNDEIEDSITTIGYPVSTDIDDIKKRFAEALERQEKEEGIIAVFSTYQSIEVLSKAQKEFNELHRDNEFVFDLTICDEAHRTTGQKQKGKKDKYFTMVHDDEYIQTHRRLYMTATPRIYKDEVKKNSKKQDILLYSMDDEDIYGEVFHKFDFGDALKLKELTPYDILVLDTKKEELNLERFMHERLRKKDDKKITLDKMIGVINALSKRLVYPHQAKFDPKPMRKVVVFCSRIDDSEAIAESFEIISKLYADQQNTKTLNSSNGKNSFRETKKVLRVEARHIDGTMKANERIENLKWLDTLNEEEETIRMLTNVRCLSEGVDVPSLDACVFMSTRHSHVDVVQSVGRVMRIAKDKKYGYILLPIVVEPGEDPAQTIKNKEEWKTVWSVIGALCAHDRSLYNEINRVNLTRGLKEKDDSKPIISLDDSRLRDKLNVVTTGGTEPLDEDEKEKNKYDMEDQLYRINKDRAQKMTAELFGVMLNKYGRSGHWKQWGEDVGKIAEKQIRKIRVLLKKDEESKIAFKKFHSGIKKSVSSKIKIEQAIEMLGQHLISKPIFDALFGGYSFTKNNPISIALEDIVEVLERKGKINSSPQMRLFYKDAKEKIGSMATAKEQQELIRILYDNFFAGAFKLESEKNGIIYTPVEVVDFIIHSVNHVLRKHFNKEISDENISILDPFTGTGTFITRLLHRDNGLFKNDQILKKKYTQDLWANEIMLLAYYIATVNIEIAYHEATEDPDDGIGKENFLHYQRILLTDTFEMIEQPEYFDQKGLKDNSERAREQKDVKIQVIIGNPPYSAGQKSANDDAQNERHSKLEGRIREKYAKKSTTTNNRSLYDSYIKAYRWATDRIDEKDGGVIGFVTNGGWLDSVSGSGFRRCIEEEFSNVYVLNLRGGVRGKSKEDAKKTGQNIFPIITDVTIVLLVKQPNYIGKANVYYHDIGDYLSKKDKLNEIKEFKSIEHVPFQEINRDQYGDWLNLRKEMPETFIPIEPTKKFQETSESFYTTYSCGAQTNRDVWVYNFSKNELASNVNSAIDFYNEEVDRYNQRVNRSISAKKFIDRNDKKFKWTSDIISRLKKSEKIDFDPNNIIVSNYRPFCKQKFYFNKYLNYRHYQNNRLFPIHHENKVIAIPGKSNKKGFSCLISNCIPDLGIMSASQCFPLYYYEKSEEETPIFHLDKTSDSEPGTKDQYTRKDAISDYILQKARNQYNSQVTRLEENITKEDVFYYVYGFLHCPEYRETYQNDLSKNLPRIPLVEEKEDFWSFSKIGRKLADLHLNYESIPPHPEVLVVGELKENAYDLRSSEIFYKVRKINFRKDKELKSSNNKQGLDKSTIIYNGNITIKNIPLKVYDYVVNGKSAIEWIMDRYQIRTHKDSGIANDPNDWARETNKPRYILDLLLSVIHLSVKTLDLVEKLPVDAIVPVNATVPKVE